MQRVTGIMLIVAVGAAALAGCALRDPRENYGYHSGSDGLWNTSFDIIDWNFPTSVNQGPIERPERIRLERTAIGVTWATRNPIPLNEEPSLEEAPASSGASDAPASTRSDDAPGAPTASASDVDRARAALREHGAR